MYNYPVKISKNEKPFVETDSIFNGSVHTINAFGDDISNLKVLSDLLTGKRKDIHHHPLTGPFIFKKAKKGDYLKVTINDISVDKIAQCLSKSAGVKPIDVKHFGDRSALFSHYCPTTDTIDYCHGIHIPYKPMIGIIGTAMDTDIKTGHAAASGGNLDLPFVTRDVVIYLPVYVDGAYLYLGDVHANQAYGELGGIALEASADIDISVEVIKPINTEMNQIFIIGKEPFSSKNAIGIVGIGDKIDDINTAIQNTFTSAINIMQYIMPELNSSTVSNFLTTIGHLMHGQAYSKTSESTSIINILEEDLAYILSKMNFSIYELEDILFY